MTEDFTLLNSNEKYTPPKDNSNYYEAILKNPNHQTNSKNGRMATVIFTK